MIFYIITGIVISVYVTVKFAAIGLGVLALILFLAMTMDNDRFLEFSKGLFFIFLFSLIADGVKFGVVNEYESCQRLFQKFWQTM